MTATLALLLITVLTALVFDFLNGFHDAANSIATVVSTRVLSPRLAVVWAAAFNFLAAFFLEKYSRENARPIRRLTPEALRPMVAYSWPGNVRELENVIERAVVLSSGVDIGADLLPDHIAGRATAFPSLEHRPDASLFDIMDDCERHIIIDMLQKCNWNQTEAAERFRVPLSTLNQKIKRLNIEIKRKNRE